MSAHHNIHAMNRSVFLGELIDILIPEEERLQAYSEIMGMDEYFFDDETPEYTEQSFYKEVSYDSRDEPLSGEDKAKIRTMVANYISPLVPN